MLTNQLPAIEGVKEALIKLSEKFDIVIVTGRSEVCYFSVIEDQALWTESTQYWLNANLEGVPIKKFIYANDCYGDNEVHKDNPIKRTICERENVSIFIDDREAYLLEVQFFFLHLFVVY